MQPPATLLQQKARVQAPVTAHAKCWPPCPPSCCQTSLAPPQALAQGQGLGQVQVHERLLPLPPLLPPPLPPPQLQPSAAGRQPRRLVPPPWHACPRPGQRGHPPRRPPHRQQRPAQTRLRHQSPNRRRQSRHPSQTRPRRRWRRAPARYCCQTQRHPQTQSRRLRQQQAPLLQALLLLRYRQAARWLVRWQRGPPRYQSPAVGGVVSHMDGGGEAERTAQCASNTAAPRTVMSKSPVWGSGSAHGSMPPAACAPARRRQRRGLGRGRRQNGEVLVVVVGWLAVECTRESGQREAGRVESKQTRVATSVGRERRGQGVLLRQRSSLASGGTQQRGVMRGAAVTCTGNRCLPLRSSTPPVWG